MRLEVSIFLKNRSERTQKDDKMFSRHVDHTFWYQFVNKNLKMCVYFYAKNFNTSPLNIDRFGDTQIPEMYFWYILYFEKFYQSKRYPGVSFGG